MERRSIEIMDTTLRDGEQTSGVSFSVSEKLTIVQLLLEKLRVDRVEVASARVSQGEFEAVRAITQWAAAHGHLDRVEVLSFVDNGVSLDWMQQAGVKVQNLLTKGSLNHLTHQLRKTPQKHCLEIASVIEQATNNGITTNPYLEVWSSAMQHPPDYVTDYLNFLASQPVNRIMRPDPLGALTPSEPY